MNSKHMALFSLCLGFKVLIILATFVAHIPLVSFIGNAFLGFFAVMLSWREKALLCGLYAAVYSFYFSAAIYHAVNDFGLVMLEGFSFVIPSLNQTVIRDFGGTVLASRDFQLMFLSYVVLAFVINLGGIFVAEWVSLHFGYRLLKKLIPSRLKHFREFEEFAKS